MSEKSSTPTSPIEPASRHSWTRWVGFAAAVPLILFVALVLAVFGSRLARQEAGGGTSGVNSVGQSAQVKVRDAPPVVLKPYTGDELRLSDLRGQVVVLNFWGSWCVPCRLEAPALERAWRATRGQAVQFVGVNIWDAESDARRFMQEMGISYVNAPDPTGQFAIELGLTGIPETYFINPAGQIVRRWIGPLTEERLLSLIQESATAPTEAS